MQRAQTGDRRQQWLIPVATNHLQNLLARPFARACGRAGWSIDDLDAGDDRRELDFDLDPFEQALIDAESEDDDDY